MILKNNILIVINNGFLNLEIKGDSKIVMDCYNKNINIFSLLYY